MDLEKLLKQLEEKLATTVDQVLEDKLAKTISPIVSAETKKIVQRMRAERALFGFDRSGLDEEEKKEFVGIVQAAVGIRTKANEALITEQDNRGGYLVPAGVARAIERIAASVGLVLSQAQRWPMDGVGELGVPAYTGSFLTGEYLGVDAAGSVTALAFDRANLILKKWQLAFVVGNDLLADATVELADWLLALAGESLANMTDKQGLVGGGTPFDGILNNANVTVFTLASGKDTFAEYGVIDDSSDVIAQVEESVLDGAAFYMERTVWAKLRSQKDTAGNYLLPQAGIVQNFPQGGPRPAGEIMGFPVYTCRHLPANSATAVSTKYIIFGNLKALAYGSKGEMSVEQHASGSFGGKEIALADQRGMVFKHRHALAIALPAAFVVVKTAAS